MQGGGGGAPLHIQGVTHAQQKHLQLSKCQWAITVRRRMHRGLRGGPAYSLSGIYFKYTLESETWCKTENTKVPKACWSFTLHTDLWFFLNLTSVHAAASLKPYWNSQQPTHSSLCDSPLLACHPRVKWPS